MTRSSLDSINPLSWAVWTAASTDTRPRGSECSACSSPMPSQQWTCCTIARATGRCQCILGDKICTQHRIQGVLVALMNGEVRVYQEKSLVSIVKISCESLWFRKMTVPDRPQHPCLRSSLDASGARTAHWVGSRERPGQPHDNVTSSQ